LVRKPHTPPPIDDSIACLSGFPSNHSASATIFSNNPTGGLEVELLLRCDLASNFARAYEIDLFRAGGVVNIVRWNGTLGDFTIIAENIGQNVSFADGAVWFAQMVNNTITVTCNNLPVWTSDRTGDSIIWTGGNPGLGFYVDTNSGTPSSNDSFGWRNFTAIGL